MHFNYFLFILSLAIGFGIFFLYLYLKNEYKYSLSSIDVKEKGFFYFIRFHLDSLFKMKNFKNKKLILLSWTFFILLHLFTPFFLASLILKNDWNVLIAIVSIIISMNLFQKIYPSDLYYHKEKTNKKRIRLF